MGWRLGLSVAALHQEKIKARMLFASGPVVLRYKSSPLVSRPAKNFIDENSGLEYRNGWSTRSHTLQFVHIHIPH
jgi:hypothetical protein